jgi:uncharacterized protein
VTLSVPCPRCGKATDADESKPLPPAFPFCSERCRLVDLGKWFDEEYRVAGKPAMPESPPPDEE